MCAASRALWSVAFLGAGCLLATVAAAQAPAIPATPAPSAPGASPPPPPPASSAAPAGSDPPFTPTPEPAFTAESPAPPSPEGTPPGYVAPAYTSVPAPGPAAPPRAAAAVAPVSPAAAVAPPGDAAKPPHADDPRWNDAHVDRVVLIPTAETHPSGTTYLSSYEIVGLQVGHALSDRAQLTLSFVPIVFTKDPIVPLDLTLKGVLVRSGRVRVAAMASASGLLGFDSGAAALGRVGGATQFCLDDGCNSSLNMAASMVFAGQVFLFANGVGAIVRLAKNMAFLAELQTVIPIGREGGEIHALGGAAGLRFSGRRVAIDVALEAPLDRRTEPQAIPVLIGTYRFLP